MVERKGRRLLLVPEEPTGSKLSRLKKRNIIIGDPETLVYEKVWEWDEEHALDPST